MPELKFSLHSTLQSVPPFQDILCHVNLRATEDGMDIVELSVDEHSALLTAVGRVLSSLFQVHAEQGVSGRLGLQHQQKTLVRLTGQ